MYVTATTRRECVSLIESLPHSKVRLPWDNKSGHRRVSAVVLEPGRAIARQRLLAAAQSMPRRGDLVIDLSEDHCAFRWHGGGRRGELRLAVQGVLL